MSYHEFASSGDLYPRCPECGHSLVHSDLTDDWVCSPGWGGCGYGYPPGYFAELSEVELQELEQAEADSWPVGEEPAEVSGETSLVPAWALGLPGHCWSPSIN